MERGATYSGPTDDDTMAWLSSIISSNDPTDIGEPRRSSTLVRSSAFFSSCGLEGKVGDEGKGEGGRGKGTDGSSKYKYTYTYTF